MAVRPGTHKPNAAITKRHIAAEQVRANANARGYNYRWQQTRLGYLRKHPLCVHCQGLGRVTVATDLDHIIPHKGDMDKFWDRDNWQGLCHSCHSFKTVMEDGGFNDRKASGQPAWLPKPAIPLIVVCGPPGSGKSTYVDTNKKHNDLVIDLDMIISTLTGQPIHHNIDTSNMDKALRIRNKMLSNLADSKCSYDRAWLIVSAGQPKLRMFWNQYASEMVVLNPGVDECIMRIEADNTRLDKVKEIGIERAKLWN